MNLEELKAKAKTASVINITIPFGLSGKEYEFRKAASAGVVLKLIERIEDLEANFEEALFQVDSAYEVIKDLKHCYFKKWDYHA